VATLGEAFIEVHADCKPFARELALCLKATLDSVSQKVAPKARTAGEKISENIGDGVDKKSGRIRNSFKRIGRFIEDDADDWTKKLRAPFEKLAKGNFIVTRILGQIALAAGGAARRIARLGLVTTRLVTSIGKLAAATGRLSVAGFQALFGAAVNFTEVAGNFSNALSKVGASFVSLGAELASLLPTLAGGAAMIALVVGGLTALAGILVVIAAPFATLLNFALAIPAALTLVVGIILPLIIAFHGLGDAMKAVFENDPKKFAADLKALSPVMQKLVLAVRPLRGLFNDLRDSVQAGLILPILTQLQPTLRKLLPVLTAAFTAVAQAIGNIALAILKVVGSQQFLDIIATTMGEIALFLQDSAPIITQLILALGMAAQAALPIVLDMLRSFNGFLSKFADWLTTAISDGRFEKWLQNARDDLNSIIGLIGSLIGLFAEMFSQTDEGGRRFLDKIKASIDKITAWMRSPEGQHALKDLVELTLDFADALEVSLKFLKDNLIVVLAMYHTLQGVVDLIKWISNHLGGAQGAVKHFAPGAAAHFQGQFPGGHSFSGGGVVPRDEMALVHQGEPILDPTNSVARNRSILADAGMLDVLAPSTPQINVFVGNEQLDARTDYRIARSNKRTGAALTAGARI
jgi:hypothetical protein